MAKTSYRIRYKDPDVSGSDPERVVGDYTEVRYYEDGAEIDKVAYWEGADLVADIDYWERQEEAK